MPIKNSVKIYQHMLRLDHVRKSDSQVPLIVNLI